MTLRSIQKSLVRIDALQIIRRNCTNNPKYQPNYKIILNQPILDKLLEIADRPGRSFNFELLD